MVQIHPKQVHFSCQGLRLKPFLWTLFSGKNPVKTMRQEMFCQILTIYRETLSVFLLFSPFIPLSHLSNGISHPVQAPLR
jgi:hypothetical protein